MVFFSGKGPSEIGVFAIQKRQHPSVSPIEQSADSALKVIEDRINEKKKLHELIVHNSLPIESSTILEAVKRESVQDLKCTNLWRSKYESNSPGSIILPIRQNLQGRAIGTGHDPQRNVEDALLALTYYNSDLYLAENYGCQNTSPFYSVGDLLDIKQKRIFKNTGYTDKLWTLLEVNGVPDFSEIDFTQGSNLSDFLNVATNKNANDFRNWFHTNQELSEKEILREYIGAVQQVPLIQKLPSKTLRFVVTSVAGFVPVLSQITSFFDTFVVDRLFRGKSPKFFIDDLTNIQGKLNLQAPPITGERRIKKMADKKRRKRQLSNASKKRNRK